MERTGTQREVEEEVTTVKNNFGIRKQFKERV